MKQNTASQRIAAELRAQIRSGALRPGDRLPSARQMVREHGVALATAAKVLERLRRERLVSVVPGVGTVVRGKEEGPLLSRERIVAAAVAIADDEGMAALSMRAVAAELGVATMSLYRHVPSKEELVTAMVDAAMGEVGPPPARLRSWRAQLEAMAQQHWTLYGRHPWLAPALSMTRPQLSLNGMQQTEWVLAAVAKLGLSPADTLRSGVALIGYVRGMAMSLEAEREAELDTGMDSQAWMDAHEDLFAAAMHRFPTLRLLGQDQQIDMSLDALFACGLARFLDGLEALAARGG